MGERPTAEQIKRWRRLANIFNYGPDVDDGDVSIPDIADQIACDFESLLDAYEATQRPVEPSAHRSEQAECYCTSHRECRVCLPDKQTAPPAEPVCAVCKRAWNADPGTVYCGAHHGTCGMCSGPRATCKCLTSELMQPVPHRPEQAAPPADKCRACGRLEHDGRCQSAPPSTFDGGTDNVAQKAMAQAVARRMAAPPAEPEATTSIDPVLEARVFASSLNGDCCVACEQGMPCECESAADPADDVRARVTHKEALAIVESFIGGYDPDSLLHAYIAQCAELERRARERCEQWRSKAAELRDDGSIDYCVRHARADEITASADSLAELLGTEEA